MPDLTQLHSSLPFSKGAFFVPLLSVAILSFVPCFGTEESVTIAPVDEARIDGTGREHMIENQTKNMGVNAVPAPGKVDIDGSLDDWDLSGRISSFASYDLREDYSAETAMMWDSDCLYIAFRFKDKTPAFNTVDPEVDASNGWKGDAFQIRAQTDKTFWLTGWHYTPKQQPTILIDNWNNHNNPDKGTTRETFMGTPGEVELGSGLQMATRAVEGGYIQEIRLPWKSLYSQVPEIGGGIKFRMGFEYVWGDVTGNTWPEHRYADNLQPETDSRLFFWTATKAWGDVTLTAKGGLPVRQYRPQNNQLRGPVEIVLNIPEAAKRFSAVIDDSKGKRVRNLIADVSPKDFSVGQSGGKYEVRLRWDGRDELGQLVPVGEYQVRGLWHEGIGAYLDTVFYNPGSPPWDTADTSGSWGADHSPPSLIAHAGDGMAVGWHFAEGGHGLISLGPDGLKKWGEKRGAVAVAGDENHIFSIATMHRKVGNLCRFHKKDGSYAFFERMPGEPRFDIPLETLISGLNETGDSGAAKTEVLDMALGNGNLFFAVSDGRLVTLDKESLKLVSETSVPGLAHIDVSPSDTIHALANGKLVRIDPDSGAIVKIPTPGLETAGDLSVSPEGLIAVMDLGPDYQPKVYSPKGELVARLALQGGRPIRGDYDPEAVSHVHAIAYDSRGDLWVTENWDYPRRVSVWGKDGKLVRDYIGNTRYGATGCYLHDQDPDFAYVGPVEMKLNRHDHSYEVTRILWVSDPARADEPELFTVSQGHAIPSRFRSSAGGIEREFLFNPSWVIWQDPQVVYMEDENGWRPVSAFGHVWQLSGEMKGHTVVTPPSGDYADLNPMDGYFWNDLNGDGRVQRVECIIIPAVKDRNGNTTWAQMNLSNNWNNTINPEDLSFDGGGGYRFKPLRFTEKGAPVYGPEGVELVLDVSGSGSIAYSIPEDQRMVVYGRKQRPNLAGFDMNTQEMIWSYPNDYSGVHGSHAAPMSAPGLIIGTLKVLGHAKVDGLGTVFAMRGNQGEDYYLTSDGLYIGSVFADSRLTVNNLGESIEGSMGYPLQGQPDEPFSGWFARQSDGKIRNLTSLSKQAAVVTEMRGLETIHRFSGPRINVDAAAKMIIAAYAPPTEEEEGEKIHTIVRTSDPGAWDSVEALDIKGGTTPETAKVRLQYDAKNLYLRYEVTDRSPMRNAARDYRRLFKTGDAVDLQISAVPSASRSDPGQGDSRILFSFMEGKPLAVLIRPVDDSAPSLAAHTYDSGVGPKSLDRVELREDIEVSAGKTDSGYHVTSSVPWSLLGIQPQAGLTLFGDVGIIASDPSGTFNAARTYWSNKKTGLINDEPLEAWLYPSEWGSFTLGK